MDFSKVSLSYQSMTRQTEEIRKSIKRNVIGIGQYCANCHHSNDSSQEEQHNKANVSYLTK